MKMKIQMAYRYTGEDSVKLVEDLKKIVEMLEIKGHEVYVPVLDLDRPSDKKDLFLNTLKRLDGCDAILGLIKSEEKSEGMLMEIGYAWGRDKKLFIAISEDVKNTHMKEFADKVINFSDMDDLFFKLKGLN